MNLAPRDLEKIVQSNLEQVARRYAVAVSPLLLALVDLGDPNDPIARQFLPSLDELVQLPEELADPIGDHAHSPVAGIVHRYPDRVLFKAVSACPVYCRFCFRREMVGPGKKTRCQRTVSRRRCPISRVMRKSAKSSSPAAIRSSCRRAGRVRSRRLAAIDHVKGDPLAHPRSGGGARAGER